MKKWQIHAAGNTLSSWDIIFVSHGFKPVDKLVFIAGSTTSPMRTEIEDITDFFGHS